MKQFVCLSFLLLFASEFLLVAESDHLNVKPQEPCVIHKTSVQTPVFEYSDHYNKESRALIDELRQIHPLFGDICNRNSGHLRECDSAILDLKSFKENNSENFSILDKYAKLNIKNEPLDVIENRAYTKQKLEKTTQEIRNSMYKKYPYEPGKASEGVKKILFSISAACWFGVLFVIRSK